MSENLTSHLTLFSKATPFLLESWNFSSRYLHEVIALLFLSFFLSSISDRQLQALLLCLTFHSLFLPFQKAVMSSTKKEADKFL